MTKTPAKSWQAIQAEVTRRINTRIWPPGEMLPNEVDLAVEFGCARTTVNRALQALADKGVLERRRKAGTRVALNPVRKVVLSIPIIREEIEQSGAGYGYQLINAQKLPAPPAICDALQTPAGTKAYSINALHLAGGKPFVFEERWVNILSVPTIQTADLAKMSANEWLVQNAPFSRGTLSFSAIIADEALAKHLTCPVGSALFCLERGTWNGEQSITRAHLYYGPGYKMETSI